MGLLPKLLPAGFLRKMSYPAMRTVLLTLALLTTTAAAAPPARRAELTKGGGRFHLEGAGGLAADFARALPMLRGFAGYEGWALKDINKPRGGRKKAYMISINGLKYEPARERFRFFYSFKRLFKGKYVLNLRVENRLDEKPPRLIAKLETPTRMVKDVRVELIFHFPKEEGNLDVELKAEAASHWIFYHLVPLRLLRANAEDRVLTVFENADRKFAAAGP